MNFARGFSCDVICTLHFHQEDYITKVKALLGKELNLENGSHVEGVEQNGKTNGFTNGSHKDEDVTMDVPEEEVAIKSPTGPKGKGGRRSKANSDTKSKFKIQPLHSKMDLIRCLEKTQSFLFLTPCRISSQYKGYKKQWETANYHVNVL